MPETISVPRRGSTLPDIPLTAPDGSSSTLDAVRAGRPALVLFMRSSTCPVCHAHARDIVRLGRAGGLRGAAFILIAPGDGDDARVARDRQGSDLAEVWASGDHHADIGLGRFLALQHSGSFVLDADGTILHGQTSTLPMGAFTRADAIAALAEVRPAGQGTGASRSSSS
jgi:peroxiredoxin